MGRFATMRGPTKRLERIGNRLERAGEEVPDKISAAVEPQILPLIEGGYKTRSSPYGTPWPEPVAGNEPMEIDGKLRRSYAAIRLMSSMRWIIYVSNDARSKDGAYYGGILQAGFKHWQTGKFIEPRKQVPDKGDVAPRWAVALYVAGRRASQAWARSMLGQR